MSSRETRVQIPAEVSTPARAVVELFRGAFAEVRFPDVDLAQLEALVSAAAAARQAVDAARAALGAAQAELDARLAELEQRAERAHAYARVFAEGDPKLAEQVAQIPPAAEERARRKASAEPRRRGRPKKAGPELPLPTAGMERLTIRAVEG
jgi:hypothetical protein